ncbi:MAG: hypothetical protein AAFZ07_26805 [Actinomycetota bacterium]
MSTRDVVSVDVEDPHRRGAPSSTWPGVEPGSGGSVSRRRFLHRVGLGAATVFVVADGLLAYRAWDQGVLAEGTGPAFDALRDWRSFDGPEAAIAAAVLAASAHNTQPWAFAIRGERIEVYADRSRSTGANDPLMRELDVSLGCAIENLVLAAEAAGYATSVELDPPTQPDLVATVALERGSVVVSELYDAIDRRRSNRSDFTDDPIPDGVMASMSDLADAGTGVAWLHERSDRVAFAELLVRATRAHNEDEAQSVDSFAWWRSDWDQIQDHKDGLNIDGVGLSPLVRTLGKILPGTSRSAADETFLERTEQQADTAAAFGVVTVDDPGSLEQRLRGGRVLQRLHLWATANDIGFQHMNQITERIDRDRQLGHPDVFEGPLTALAGPGVLAAFRVGTPTVESMASPRRPVSEVLR